MTLKMALNKILTDWNLETKKTFKENSLAKFIREDFVQIVQKITYGINNQLEVKASAGAGNWANIPWLSILDREITDSTQHGIYPVYLFRADGSGVYLSLSQGMTQPTKLQGAHQTEKYVKRVANFLRNEITELNNWESGDLKLLSSTHLGQSYEKPNIGYKYYDKNFMPTNNHIEKDLKKLLTIYKKVSDLIPSIPEYKTYMGSSTLKKQPTNTQTHNLTPTSVLTIPKPFLLLAGISGTGKTRFIRTQAARSNGWPDHDHRKPDNYELVPVRPDWHEPSDLLGYVSRINGEKYIPTNFLSFIIKAWHEIFTKGGSLSSILETPRPFWLCLDEMNLAPVEQYFADYLSILESRKWTENKYSSLPLISDKIELVRESFADTEDQQLKDAYKNEKLWDAFYKNKGIPIPQNLIVAGTVNMDETTHGFPRKVIDRALTIDFQEFFPNKFDEFFEPKTEPKLLGFSMSSHVRSKDDLMEVSADPDGKKSIDFLSRINDKLKSTPFELAFRALNELLLSVKCFNPKNDKRLTAVWDDFLMQKVLPRIEGDAEKLKYTGEEDSGLLNELKEIINTIFLEHMKSEEGKLKRPDLLNQKPDGSEAPECTCKSLDKIEWMQARLEINQYTSFWA